MILIPTILLQRVDYYCADCSYIWCDVNYAYTFLFVLLRLAVRSQESEDHPGTWNLKSQASCALDHFHLPNNALYYHLLMHRFNFYGTQ